MALPPLFAGVFHDNLTLLSLGTAVNFVGDDGVVHGVAVRTFTAGYQSDAPAAFTARTLNEYSWPFVNFCMLISVFVVLANVNFCLIYVTYMYARKRRNKN